MSGGVGGPGSKGDGEWRPGPTPSVVPGRERDCVDHRPGVRVLSGNTFVPDALVLYLLLRFSSFGEPGSHVNLSLRLRGSRTTRVL